jgi:HK97 family phage portal protein
MPSFLRRISDVGRALRGNPLDNPAVPLSAGAGWMYDLFGGAPTSSGVAVNEKTAMQLTSVYSCINVLASAFSSLPCELLERKGKGRQPAIDVPLHDLLAIEPNPEMSAVSFWGALMACAALLGNAYARIQWDKSSPTTPIALWPMHPCFVHPQRNQQTGLLEYQLSVNGTAEIVKPKDMLHVPGLTLDGFVGVDPIRAARQSIGTGIAASKHIGAFFGRGSRPSGVLTRTQQPVVPGTLGAKTAPEALDKVRESWERANAGDNQGRTAVLPTGWDWKAISITPEQAQFLQIMQYTRTEIAGLWQIPPHMIGDTSRLSNSNGQSEAQNFLTTTLRPWIVRFESEIRRKLLPRVGRNASRFTVRFDTTELMRLDFATQIEAIAMGRQWGLYNADEGREKLGENPIGGIAGKQYLVPLNMVTAEQLAEQPASNDPDADDVDPNESGDQDDVPAGNGGRNQRKLLERMARAYRGLFRDAAGRLTARDKRDAAAVQQILGPVLEAIAAEGKRQACQMFRLKADVDLAEEKILRDTVRGIEKRAAAWTATTVDADAERELKYAVRAIMLGVFREAATAIVLPEAA